MKKIIIPILILMFLPLLFACSNENTVETGKDGNFFVYATIEKIEKTTIEVLMAENQDAYGAYLINVYDGTEYLDPYGNEISKSDLKAGDKISITYNGQVTKSLPPQITALKIQKQ